MMQGRWASIVGVAVIAALLFFVFRLYLHPDMILEFSNLVFCS